MGEQFSNGFFSEFWSIDAPMDRFKIESILCSGLFGSLYTVDETVVTVLPVLVVVTVGTSDTDVSLLDFDITTLLVKWSIFDTFVCII